MITDIDAPAAQHRKHAVLALQMGKGFPGRQRDARKIFLPKVRHASIPIQAKGAQLFFE